ncbi:hypothetical protein [Nocardioides humi]
MSDEQDKLKLSLEPPKLFGRKKKAAEQAEAPAPAAPERPARPVARPEPAPEPEPTPEPEPEVVEAAEPEVAEPEVAEPEVAEPVAAEPVVEAEPVEEPAVDEPAAVEPEPEPEPAPQAAPKPAPKPGPKPTEPAPKPTPKPTPKPARKPKPAPAPVEVDVEPEPVTAAALEDAEIAALSDDGPLLTVYRAAALTGLVVGAAMVVLTWLSLRGCEAVRGTSSCGGGPGFLLLVATFALCVLLGAQLLKAFTIPDPGSSSFLAVGLVAVVALLFLINLLDHWSTLIIVPLLSVGAYLASVWVTKTFVDPADE